MNSIESFRSLLATKRGRLIGIGVIGIIVVLGFVGLNKGGDEEVASEEATPIVKVTTAAEYLGGESVSLVGTVRAFSEAAITSERAGRVTSVRVGLGDTVSAGQIIATLESASEQAAVLQAEGVYEAALASAAQSGLSVDEANTALESTKRNAINTIRSTFTTNNGVIVNEIDDFFSQPNSPLPGLKVGGQGYTQFLNSERVAYQSLLTDWKNQTDSLTIDSDITTAIETARVNTQRTLTLVDTFLAIFDVKDDEKYTADEIRFTNLRSSLLAQLSALDGAQNAIQSATDVVRRAEVSASGGQASASDAQVKQALGSLRAAQANLAKTILRSPISGTVNSLDVRTGDFISSFAQVAEVANNNALEVVTYVGDTERALLSVGDIVLVENTYEGRVSEIAPAVDSVTRKTEVRIAVEDADIQNGDTVTISKEITEAATSASIVPLTAVKFELEDGFMFFVEDGVLISRPVTLGVVRGGSVEITSGLSQTEEFVVDARGLLAGTAVEVSK